MNYPIPTHLKSIFRVNENNTDTSNLSGSIICNCGCEYFSILHNENRQYDETLCYSEQDGLKVVAVCNNCHKKHLIFDEATQGYNGLVCDDFKTAPDNSLTDFICHKCGSTIFSISLDIEIEDKEQFIEECVNEYPDRFSPDDYVDSFDWITINGCCLKSIEIRKLPVPIENIDKRSNNSFMDRFIFRKTDRFSCKTFEPCS